MTQNLYVKEIYNKEQAVKYGGKRGWCTADDTRCYHNAYNTDKGRLFVIFKPPKKKPQYQIFFSKFGGCELRAKFNKYVHPNKFFREEGKSLFDWYSKLINETNDLLKQDKEHYAGQYLYQDFSNENIRTDFPNYLIIHNVHQNARREGILGRPVFEVEMKISSPDLVNVHRQREIPAPNRVPAGTVIQVQEGGITLIRGIHPGLGAVYYRIKTFEWTMPLSDFDLNTMEQKNNQVININELLYTATFMLSERDYTNLLRISTMPQDYSQLSEFWVRSVIMLKDKGRLAGL